MNVPFTTEHNEGEVSSGTPVPVTVEQVDAYFGRLWRNVAETAQARGGSAQTVTVAQVLNLVVNAGNYDQANAYAGDLEQITGRHPCRIINVIRDAKEGEEPVQAYVSIHCKVSPAGGRQVCSELVTVVATTEDARRIPAAVIPLLISDLPTFLWWPHGSPFDDDLFRSLGDSADRLIVDSSTFENPEGTLSKMSQRLNTTWPKTACTDTNWGRITHWREMIAQFFDGPALRPYLDRVNNVTISFALSERVGVNRAQALLLAGWLTSRLGWQPVDSAYELLRVESGVPNARLSLRAGQRPSTITLKGEQKATDVRGDIHSVMLEVIPEGAEKAEASFTVALPDKRDEHASTCIEIDGVETTTRPMQMRPLTRSELLDNELEIFSHDKIYEDSLDMVGQFIQSSVKKPEPGGPRKLVSGEPISAGAQAPRPRTTGPEGTPQQ